MLGPGTGTIWRYGLIGVAIALLEDPPPSCLDDSLLLAFGKICKAQLLQTHACLVADMLPNMMRMD